MTRRGLVLAAAVILVTNAFVLLGVARNRAGRPLQTIQLTERELPMNYRGKEDSGVALRIQWNQYSFAMFDQYSWLDRAKLESLGFDCDAALRDRTHPPLPRPAFVVLEYNGPAWEAFQKSQEERNANRGFPQAMIMQSSRLVSIDAAKAPELLQKYVDQRKYMIVRGVVRLGVGIWDLKSQTPGAYRLEPSISEIMPGTIHVPLPLSTVLADRSSHTAAANLQYTVTLSYGSRFEPWVLVE